MRNFIGRIVGVICLMGMTNYASADQIYSWQNIKQEATPTAPKPASVGYLKVYTNSQEVNDGGYLWVRGPRYTIFSDKGKAIKAVRNDSGTPNIFTLLPGKYVIVPDDRRYKSEIVGAVLEPGKLTVIHLPGA